MSVEVMGIHLTGPAVVDVAQKARIRISERSGSEE
jgi:hypothetical protein